MIAAWPPDVRERTVRATPLGRAGTPEEVAAVVLWLASDAAAFVHGAHVDVNGGLLHGLGTQATRGGAKMAKEAKVCRGTWCMAFGFDPRWRRSSRCCRCSRRLGLRRRRARRLLRPRDGRALPGQGEPQEAEGAHRLARARDRGHRAGAVRRSLPASLGDRLAGGLRRVPRVLRELPPAGRRHGDPRHARRSRRGGAASLRRGLRRDLGPGGADLPAPRREGRRGRLRHALGARVAAAVQQAVGDGEDAAGRRQPATSSSCTTPATSRPAA